MIAKAERSPFIVLLPDRMLAVAGAPGAGLCDQETEDPMAAYAHPEAIVSTAWLAANLGDPKLRIFDCSTYL